MLGVVLDTNVVVSGHLKPGGNEDSVVNLFYSGRIRLLVSEPILEEYEAVLRRPKFRLDYAKIDLLVAKLRSDATLVRPAGRIRACKHADDDKFIECALAGNAQYLVTGNTRHFPKRPYRGLLIVTAAQFLAAFALYELGEIDH